MCIILYTKLSFYRSIDFVSFQVWMCIFGDLSVQFSLCKQDIVTLSKGITSSMLNFEFWAFFYLFFLLEIIIT